MPTDTLSDEAQSGLKAANQVLRSKRIDDDARRQSIVRLKNLDERLCTDIELRQTDYLKQIGEILHPSVDYRNELGRKLSVLIATILLICALGVVVWLRYQAISEQLGLNSDTAGTFGGSNSSLVWQNLGPTIGMNLFVWGVGVLYSYLASEKVPHLREAYRASLRANKKLYKARLPFEREQSRLTAHYDRERQKNDVAVKEYKNLSEEIRGALARLEA